MTFALAYRVWYGALVGEHSRMVAAMLSAGVLYLGDPTPHFSVDYLLAAIYKHVSLKETRE